MMYTQHIKKLCILLVSLLACGFFSACSAIDSSIQAEPVSYPGTLVLSVAGVADSVRIGGIDVTLAIPQSVSVKAQKNGLVGSSVITPLLDSSRPFLTGKFSDNLLRIALISPTGFSSGKLLHIKVNGISRDFLRSENFSVQSFQLVDLKGTTISGASVHVDAIR